MRNPWQSPKKKNMQSNKQKLWILLGVIAVIAIIVIVAASQSKKTNTNTNDQANSQPTANQSDNTQQPAAGNATEASTPAVNPVLKDTTVVVPGANPITKDNKVVTIEGKPTKNDVVPMSPQAPQQTAPVDKNALSKSVIKLEISSSGWSPNSFSVKAGAPVSLAVSSVDKYTHVFMFDDSSLSAVAIGVGPNETRAITFNAPAKAGEYKFHCDVPGHSGRGEVGTMIVK